MFLPKAIFCRVFQGVFRAALPLLPYRNPEIIPSCGELDRVFKKENSQSVLLVTDEGIIKNGLTTPVEDVLKRNRINYTIYGKTQSNPTVSNAEEALKLYFENRCDTLIAIGVVLP